MILGHAATTLVAKRAAPDMCWWLLVVSAFLIDIAMFSFVALGIETMAPTGADGPSLATKMTQITFSHDLVPQIGWTLLAGAIAFAVTGRRVFALIAMALSLAGR